MLPGGLRDPGLRQASSLRTLGFHPLRAFHIVAGLCTLGTEKAGQVLGDGRQGTPCREVAEYKEMWPQFGTLSYYLGGQGQKDEEAHGACWHGTVGGGCSWPWKNPPPQGSGRWPQVRPWESDCHRQDRPSWPQGNGSSHGGWRTC